jgi:hypothetical protein
MYLPTDTHGPSYVSHEAMCILNPSKTPCPVHITLYFENRDPVELESVICAARRTVHIRTDTAKDVTGVSIPKGIGYAAVVVCDNPEAVVQYTRVDTTQSHLALMTTIAHQMKH